MNRERRGFLKNTGKIVVVLAGGWSLSGCLFAVNPSEPVSPESGDLTGSISDNHLHIALLSQDDWERAAEITLDITGNSTHPHFVTLRSSDFAALNRGETVTLLSSNDWGHAHYVAFRRQPPE